MGKILGIDDNRINLELLSHMIKMYYSDFAFLSAKSGEEGIEIALNERPDLILLDIMMPGIDGFEACKFLKNNNLTRKIPIIMISALGSDSNERTKGLNVGADAFISKPFEPTELRAQINVALRIKNYQERLKKLNTEITLIEEKQRRQIAENLHDSLGQTLSLAFMNLSSISIKEDCREGCSQKISNTINFTIKLLNKAIKESRTLTYDLSPPILYELGLIPAVKWRTERFQKEYGIKTMVIAKDEKPKIKKEEKIFLYRIIGELLTNISKHSKATEVVIKFEEKDRIYKIKVEDNGIGIDKNQIKKTPTEGGFGLLSIMERIDSLDGQFTIDPTEKGTIAKIEIPIVEKQEYQTTQKI